MKYLQKNQKRIIFLQIQRRKSSRQKMRSGTITGEYVVSGHACLDPAGNREEEVVNDINGTETDCVLSVLSSPYQESFISRNKTLLNTKLWFGMRSNAFEKL